MNAENIVAGLNPVQREAVVNSQGPMLILAGAGSGKTSLIGVVVKLKVHNRQEIAEQLHTEPTANNRPFFVRASRHGG